jgi:hypothetical protein
VGLPLTGQTSTNMTRSVTPEMFRQAMRWLFPVFKLMTGPDNGISAAKASQSLIYLASSVEVEGATGKYFNLKCIETAMPKSFTMQKFARIFGQRFIK